MIFSSLQISSLTGFSLTLRQLQWWDETRAVQPNHVGHAREYDGPTAMTALILWKLRLKGMTFQTCRKHIRAIYKAARGQEPYFVVFRDEAEVANTDRMVDLFREADGPMYVVDLDDLRDLLAPPTKSKAA